ncbi:M56 family metallopeptidase [Maribacter sp. X9]|uniref:M56 family metallopeptidase n=1 Tax=Maribacter sp. X9 TaxID=3402159 RepID=UPI003AF3BDDF
MVLYLLKSTACLAIFIAFYKAFLEQESIHVFKRFYLLVIILVSFTIPAIVFTEYVEIQGGVTKNIQYSTPLLVHEPTTTFAQPEEIDWSQIGWVIYGFGVLVFGIKFCKNLFNINQRIRKNQKIETESNIKVLLEKSIVPHTFFRYIFLNKKKYLNGKIPAPVICHEESHAKQKHSIDVLIIELLQTLCWFNPLLYILKHAIKLNHEFLADQAVIQQGSDPSDYQKIILSYSSIHQPSLANAINYSSIKKRFTIMKKQTSRKGIILRTTIVLPLLVSLLFAFSQTKVEPIIIENSSNILKIEIKKENEIWFKDAPSTLENLADKITSSNLDDIDMNTSEAQIYSNEIITSTLVDNITKELRKIGVKRITVFSDGYIIPEEDYKDTIEIMPETVILKTNQIILRPTDLNKYNSLAKKYNIIPIEKRTIPLEDLHILETLYREMTEEQKQNAQPFPECIPKKKKDGASKEQLKTYATLAKKYNTMDPEYMYIKKQEVDILQKIYGLMTPKQKAEAEPFPNFPELPPIPKAPKPPKNVSNVVYAANQIDSIIEEQDPYDVVGGSITRLPKQPNQPVAPTYEKDMQPNSPPVPPTPKSPLDFAIEMAKKGAIFKYEGKQISSDKAIDLLKKNKDLNMDSRTKNGTQTIRITKEPIFID